MTSIPLVRMLTDAGYGSRRESSQLVRKGLVEINGRIASSYTEPVDPAVDSIVVTGKKVAARPARRVYIVMNKPGGYLCTTEDDRGRPTVMDLLPEHVRRAGLHPAGRLDEDSTGLLILTNDGQLTYELTHPRYEHEKEYYVATTGRLTDADLDKLEQGVEIEGQKTWPARMKLLLGQSPYTYSITIHEGRKRQIRLMFAAIGQQVAMLKRVRIGGLLLENLEEGKWRELTPQELRKLTGRRAEERRPSRAAGSSRRPPTSYAADTRGSSVRDSRSPGRPSRTFTPSAERRTGAPADRRDRSRPGSRPQTDAGAPRRWSGSGPSSDTRPSRFADDRDSRPHVHRKPDTSADRPYRRTDSDRDSRPYARRATAERRQEADRRTEGDRDARPYVRRERDTTADRPQRRTPPGSDSGPYTRRDAGAERPAPYRRTDGDRPARPNARRHPGATTSRPYHRSTTETGSRPYAQRDSAPDRQQSYRRPEDRRDSGRYERRDSGSPAARPPRQAPQERSGPPDARQRRGPERTEGSRQRSRDDDRARPQSTPPNGRARAQRPQSRTPRRKGTATNRPSSRRRPPEQR